MNGMMLGAFSAVRAMSEQSVVGVAIRMAAHRAQIADGIATARLVENDDVWADYCEMMGDKPLWEGDLP